MAAFFSFGLGIGRKYYKDEGLEQTICKAFKVRLRLADYKTNIRNREA